MAIAEVITAYSLDELVLKMNATYCPEHVKSVQTFFEWEERGDKFISPVLVYKAIVYLSEDNKMGVFVCDECSAIENTALGWYHGTDIFDLQDNSKKGKKLCCQCSPEFFSDGSRIRKHKEEWHQHFPRQVATEELLLRWGVDNFVYLGKFQYLKENTPSRI